MFRRSPDNGVLKLQQQIANVERCRLAPVDLTKKLAVEVQAETIRNEINNSLQNLGIVAAFMCSLAGNIYVEPVEDPGCFENWGLTIMFWLEWFSMGLFFLTISMTLILSNDINAIPNSLLLAHLKRTENAHAVPEVLTALGLFFLASGYGVDIDMRTDCRFGYMGVVMAPLFPVVVIGTAWVMKHLRADFNTYARATGHREDMRFGRVWFTTWHEQCFPSGIQVTEGDRYLDTICDHCNIICKETSNDKGASFNSKVSRDTIQTIQESFDNSDI